MGTVYDGNKVIACVTAEFMVIWEPSCESWSLPGEVFKSPLWWTLTSRFSNEHNYLQTRAIV